MALKKTEKEVDVKEALTQLLKVKAPAIFEREPAPAYNGNLDSLVEDIIKLI